VRVQAFGDQEAGLGGVGVREPAGGGDGARALVDGRVGVSSLIAVWYSNITCSPPWLISGWYGVYGVRNSDRCRIESINAGT
jgi:hypothetical protein